MIIETCNNKIANKLFSDELIYLFFSIFPQDESHHRKQSYEIKSEDDLKDPRSDADLKNKQIKVLQETIRNLQRKLIETSTKEKQNETKINELEEVIRESNVKELLLRTKIANARTTSVTNDDASETSSIAPMHSIDSTNEPQIISLATAFLVIHPLGCKVDSIHAYVHQFVASIGESEVLDVLNKNEKLFTCSVVENNQLWFYSGFKLP